MARVQIRVRGVREVSRALDEMWEMAKGALGEAMYNESHRIMLESQQQVPVDTSRLLRSAFVTLPMVEGNRITIVAGYDTPYAVMQHERTDLNHRVGKAKFLSDPLFAATGGMLNRIGRDTFANLQGGVTTTTPRNLPIHPPETGGGS
jgi:hypothetical protein